MGYQFLSCTVIFFAKKMSFTLSFFLTFPEIIITHWVSWVETHSVLSFMALSGWEAWKNFSASV